MNTLLNPYANWRTYIIVQDAGINVVPYTKNVNNFISFNIHIPVYYIVYVDYSWTYLL
jgi:hypothetical protein